MCDYAFVEKAEIDDPQEKVHNKSSNDELEEKVYNESRSSSAESAPVKHLVWPFEAGTTSSRICMESYTFVKNGWKLRKTLV